jgi:hypothetical protein
MSAAAIAELKSVFDADQLDDGDPARVAMLIEQIAATGNVRSLETGKLYLSQHSDRIVWVAMHSRSRTSRDTNSFVLLNVN